METLKFANEIVIALQESPLWYGMPKEEQTQLFWRTYLLWTSIDLKLYIHTH